ncbi:MAG: carbohydrate binding family 9 domain-containing protein, partial [Deltaproteobacteria bacterium]|nr:carbohydrate binding family 9 domain-containing protein [Kofleriaceae bacterium]
RRAHAVDLDGRLDEEAWRSAPVHGDFWQRQPNEGAAPTQRTEFRLLYDDQAIYVGVRAHDSDRARIRAMLHRRDQDSVSDWIGVMLDSYHDRRTAFSFAVNAAGVQRDVLIYNDTAEDPSWDAVWSSATAIDGDGWSAELRIPLGQLRFSAGEPRWGIQVMRYVGREGEQSLWSPSPRNAPGFVSNFGVLDGLEGLTPTRRVEVLPYVTGGFARMSDAATDPFVDTVDPRANVGVDARYGLGPNVTVTATINPDFGQVEADPSQVNLSGNETYFAEKRPFFLEGTEIFRVQIGEGGGPGGLDTLFYSRRIGATPHGSLDGEHVDIPTGTTIYGAAKIAGKTAGGLSFGLLDAVTAEETGVAQDAMGTRTRGVVEPLTNHALGVVRKDLREGRTSGAAALTHVARALDGTGMEDELHDQAVTGALLLDHKWGADDRYYVTFRGTGSWVHGTPQVILNDQLTLRHLYQRPDAGHVEVDPTRESLSGFGATWSTGGRPGKHLNLAVGGDMRSPGWEANDLGFHTSADRWIQWMWGQYRDDEAGDRVSTWQSNFDVWAYGSSAPDFHGYGASTNTNATFNNFWFLGGGVSLEMERISTRALRGGRSLVVEPSFNNWVNVNSDGRKPVSFSLNLRSWRQPGTDSHAYGTTVGMTVQARSNVELFVGPSYDRHVNDGQFVEEVVDGTARSHYVFGRIFQHTMGVTLRGAWTFTPDLSLQVYAQPFLATGAYRELKQTADTHALHWGDRFTPYRADQLTRTMDDAYLVDENGDGASDYAFSVPDFSFRELRSNVVLRWQYRPGSTVFFIWSHGRADAISEGNLDVSRELRGLARAPGENVVMVKANYWFGV